MKVYHNQADLIKELKDAISIKSDIVLRCDINVYLLNNYVYHDRIGYNYWKSKIYQVEYTKEDGISIIYGEGKLSKIKVCLTNFGFIPDDEKSPGLYYCLTINSLINILRRFQKEELSYELELVTKKYEDIYKDIQTTAEKYWINDDL